MALAFADLVRHRRRYHEDLERGDPAAAVRPFEQGLRDHSLEGHREHHTDLILAISRELVDDPVDRACGR